MKQHIPRILVLTPRFPYPVVGGDRLRIYQVCKALAAHCQITLLSLCESREELELRIPDDKIFQSVERYYLPSWSSWLNCLLAIPTDLPLQVAYFRNGAFKCRAHELAREHDATIAHLIRVGDIVKDLPGLNFLEMTDAISLNYERISQSHCNIRHDFRARIFAFEARRLRAYEKLIVNKFNHSFLVSEIDRLHLFHNRLDLLDRVSVFSNGVEFQQLPFMSRGHGADLIFIGNMNSMQNFDAALYMARDILPQIRRFNEHARLIVIGRISLEKARELRLFPCVEVTGEVPDVATAAASGAVGVCPLRLGAGVQNKVLEYMALGLPVVSTSLGFEGFSARLGHDILIADETQQFAAAVIRLLQETDFSLRMAKNARHYVEFNHSWERKLKPLVDIVCSAIELQK